MLVVAELGETKRREDSFLEDQPCAFSLQHCVNN